jgi:hypothetical protein
MARLFTHRWARDVAAVALLLALTGLVAGDRLRFDRALDNVDILTQFVPLYSLMADQIREGMLPRWNPYQFAGVPLAADPLSGWLSLPAMASFLLFPPVLAAKVHFVVHLVLAGLGAYALGRALGLGAAGAAAAGIAYEFGPHAQFSTCCTTQMQLGAWLPISLLGVELAARAPSRAKMVGWWGVSGFAISQMLTGWFGKGSMYALLIVASFIAYRLAFGRVAWPHLPSNAGRAATVWTRVRAVLAHGAAIGLIGLGLSAGTLLPRLDYLERTNLDGGEYERVAPEAASTGGWAPSTALDRVFNPRYLRWHIGGVVLGLALAAPILAGRRFGVPYFAVSSAAVVILTTRAGPLHDLFYLIPRFQTLHEHVPSRILTVGNLGTAILAGASVSAVTEGRLRLAEGWTRLRSLAWAVPLVAILALSAGLDRGGYLLSASTRNALLFVAAMLFLAAAPVVLRARLSPRGSQALGIVSAGLLLVGLFWNPVGEILAIDIRTENPRWAQRQDVVDAFLDEADAGGAGAFLRAQGELGVFRYFGYDARFLPPEGRLLNYHAFYTDPGNAPLLVSNRSVLLGLQDVQGYNPVHPRAYDDYLEAMNGHRQEYHESAIYPGGLDSPLLDLLNARYIVVPAQVPPGRPDLLHLSQRLPTIYADATVRVVENLKAMPRAWIVHDARQEPPEVALRLLDDGTVDPAVTALLETDVPDLAPPSDPAGESVVVTSYTADAIDLRVQAEAAGLVVVSETWDADWRAYVDGERVDVLRANALFRSVWVESGDHLIELRYEPRAFSIGLATSSGTAGLLLVAVCWLALREHMRGRATVPVPSREAPPQGGSWRHRPLPRSSGVDRRNGGDPHAGTRRSLAATPFLGTLPPGMAGCAGRRRAVRDRALAVRAGDRG